MPELDLDDESFFGESYATEDYFEEDDDFLNSDDEDHEDTVENQKESELSDATRQA